MRTLRFLAVGAIALSLLWACSDDEDEIAPEPVPGTEPTEEYDEAYYAEHATVSSEDAHFTLTDEGGEIAFKVEGGEVVLTVDCGTEWTAAVEYLDEEDGWLDATVNCSAGTLTVTAEANTVEAVKTAAVTVMTAKSGIEFATISVAQNAYGACEIKVDTNEWNVPAVGDDLTTEIAVEANADWEITNTAEWLTAEKTDTGLKLTASENDTTEERTAEVVLTCTDGVSTDSETVTVTQDGKAYITVAEGSEELTFTAEGGTETVEVESNFEVECSASEEWLTVEVADGVLTVTASENESAEVREGVVTLTAGDGAENGAEATIAVTQEGRAACTLTVETNEWNAPAVGELTTEIAVEANADWDVETDAEWLTAEKTDTGLKLTASENDTTEERTAEVVLTCTDGVSTASDTVTVTQDAKAYITVAEGSKVLTFTAEGGTETVEVESNFEVECSASVDWLTVEVADGVLTVTASANETEVEREGTVTLTAGDGAKNVAEETVSVTQACFVAEDDETLVFGYTMTSGSQEAMLPLNGTVDCTVDWGDGSATETVTSTLPTHTYAEAGDYEVSVYGTVTQIASYVSGSKSGVTSYLTSVKHWGDTGLTSMQNAFRGCSKLTALPEETGDAFANVTDFSYAFYNCTGLTSLPSDLFANCSNVTTFDNTFYGCSKLASLPSDLFANCSNVTTFAQVFQSCTSLTSLPSGLFANCSKVETFYYAFCGCTGLTSLPSELFDGCTAVTNFSDTFYNCSKLETIPEGLFDAAKTKVENFNGVFYGCSALKAVPDGLFKDFTALTNIASAFRNCTSLTSTGKAVFSGCVKVAAYATYLFYGCTSLETIEDDLFEGCTAVTSFQYAFYNCTKLKEIPAGLFDVCTEVTNFQYTFQKCSALEKIPTGLFDKNTKVTNFGSTFNGCTALTEESPYTTVNGVKVHLYERADHTDVFTKPTTTSNCFNSCTGLSDYYSIPSGWGGGGD